MTTIKVLGNRFLNSPAARKGGVTYFPLYRAWKSVMLKRADGDAYFAGVRVFAKEVEGGCYSNNFPSTRKRR